MSLDLKGRRAVVTGASRGIGRAIALAYAREGADVAVLARNAELLSEVAVEMEALGGRAVVVTADVLDTDATRSAVSAAVDALGGLDILSDRERVVVVNTNVPRPWMRPNNELIASIVPDYPNAVIADWYAVSEDNPEYFVSDGTHPQWPSGIKAFVREILRAAGVPQS